MFASSVFCHVTAAALQVVLIDRGSEAVGKHVCFAWQELSRFLHVEMCKAEWLKIRHIKKYLNLALG